MIEELKPIQLQKLFCNLLNLRSLRNLRAFPYLPESRATFYRKIAPEIEWVKL